MDAKELWEYFKRNRALFFEARKSNGRFYTKLDWRILCIYQWYYNIPSAEVNQKN